MIDTVAFLFPFLYKASADRIIIFLLYNLFSIGHGLKKSYHSDENRDFSIIKNQIIVGSKLKCMRSVEFNLFEDLYGMILFQR